MIATSVSLELLIVHLQEPSLRTRFRAGLIVTTAWPTSKSDAAVLRRRSRDAARRD
jgi:chromosomal replication initiation ATPase DnaA